VQMDVLALEVYFRLHRPGRALPGDGVRSRRRRGSRGPQPREAPVLAAPVLAAPGEVVGASGGRAGVDRAH
jgi:hypothetical protein